MNNPHFSLRGLSQADIWNYENAFYWFRHPTRMAKLLAHFDLYKSILNIPGDVIELGVFKATSLIRFATFRACLESEFSRKITGFDTFGVFPRENIGQQEDIDFIDDFEAEAGEGLSLEEVKEIFTKKSFQNIFLESGNVFETLPAYLKRFPATRIAILHLDMDVKEPTSFALDLLFDRVVPGGLIVFDDYNTVAGETEAVDEFLASKGLRIEKVGLNYIPAFVRKS
ncbi:TylF/MycF family methyltransferase [Polynucleobacter sp. UB-Raua-W9]|uniref:TylF/MycF family methyltransferase n=1 Tax=Polynucleobacter sp. UB-Raua-W9 TaxID=1819736 RepID=UPI001BFD2E11|nr:TylF/MycF family methyltransferase [Polynucleobacter sp. UB-Raua-W9]